MNNVIFDFANQIGIFCNFVNNVNLTVFMIVVCGTVKYSSSSIFMKMGDFMKKL